MTKKIPVAGSTDTGVIIDASQRDFIAVDPDLADRMGACREKALTADDVRKEMQSIQDEEPAPEGLADEQPVKIQ